MERRSLSGAATAPVSGHFMQPRCLFTLVLSSTLLFAQQTPTGQGGAATPDPLHVSEPTPNVPFPFTTLHRSAATNLNSNAIYQEMRGRCPIARAADEAEPAAARAYFSPRLNAALRNWDALWTLLNDPDTPYAERIAAAYQGAATVTPDVLPRFSSVAAGRLKKLARVQFSPCDVPSWFRIEDYAAMPPYPINDAQRANAPFDWQLQRALDVLDRGVKAYYADSTRNAALLRAMEAWQPADPYEVAYRFETLLTGPRDIALLQRLIRTTLDYPTAPNAPILRTLTASTTDTAGFLERIHVAQLVLLAQTQNTALVSDMATSVLRLASPSAGGQPELKPVRTATSLLAIARWVQRPDLSMETRDALAKRFKHFVDRFPLVWDANLPQSDKEIQQMLATFDTWLASHRANLDDEAAAERPHLEELLAESTPPVIIGPCPDLAPARAAIVRSPAPGRAGSATGGSRAGQGPAPL